MFRLVSSLRVGLRLGATVVAVCVLGALAFASPAPVEGATFTVNTTSDTDDGTCNATHCTLREAINAANVNGGADMISFNIVPAGKKVIAPTSELPRITDTVLLDGTTQPGFNGTPIIRIDGLNLSGTEVGLYVDDGPGDTIIKGVVVLSFPSVQVRLWGNGDTLLGSYIGIDVDGPGVQHPGTQAGVLATLAAAHIGGPNPGDGNVISGVAGDHVRLRGAGPHHVHGNLIGLKVNGNALSGSPEPYVGIHSRITSPYIGGPTPGERNVISGLDVAIDTNFSYGQIQGNYFGLDKGGTAAVPNGTGILMSSSNVNIGGPDPWMRNVFANTLGAAIDVDGDNVVIEGNYIGTLPDGETPAPNKMGVVVRTAASNTNIVGNVIAHSATDEGVLVEAGGGAQIRQNSMLFNNALGIDVAPAGVTLPVGLSITSVGSSPTVTTISGTLTAAPSTPNILDFYESEFCDPLGAGEGEEWLGSLPVTGTGTPASFIFVTGNGATGGRVITVTVTAGSTTEFSTCHVVPFCTTITNDCDSFAEVTLGNHTGPVNTNTAFDNCIRLWNQVQLNSDGNFADQSPPHAVDDRTWANSDRFGDACDEDDDNDGLTDGEEQGLPYAPCPTASGPTNPLLFDTDGDRFHDGAECNLGTDPASAASKPGSNPGATAACGATGDADGDRLLTRIEVCGYNTNPNVMDSDGDAGLDGARDGCEAASLNADRTVNSTDQLLLAQELLRVLAGGTPLASMDINKDGNINSADQLTMSFLIIPGGQCP